MMISPRHLGALAAVALIVRAACAQNALYVEHHNGFSPVRQVVNSNAFVEENGRLVAASGHNFAFKKVGEFAPYFITVRDVDVRSTNLRINGTDAEINRQLEFKAEFESSYALDHVFLVFDLKIDELGHRIVVREVGDIRPHRPLSVAVNMPLSQHTGDGTFDLHLFVSGHEVFHSLMPASQVELALDLMVARRIQGVTDAPPSPFVGPTPEYPSKLKKRRISGEAVIGLVISPVGRVLEPHVVRATDPAFGAAALEAARQWRFLPQVSAGRAIEKNVEIPYAFTPDDEPNPKSRG